MLSVWGCKTKRDLRSKVGAGATGVFVETSAFGLEYNGEDGRYSVVGPGPYERKWYAIVTVKDGRISKVE